MTIIHLQRYSRFPSINIDAYIKAIIFVFCTCTFNTGVYGYTRGMHQLFDNSCLQFCSILLLAYAFNSSVYGFIYGIYYKLP